MAGGDDLTAQDLRGLSQSLPTFDGGGSGDGKTSSSNTTTTTTTKHLAPATKTVRPRRSSAAVEAAAAAEDDDGSKSRSSKTPRKKVPISIEAVLVPLEQPAATSARKHSKKPKDEEHSKRSKMASADRESSRHKMASADRESSRHTSKKQQLNTDDTPIPSSSRREHDDGGGTKRGSRGGGEEGGEGLAPGGKRGSDEPGKREKREERDKRDERKTRDLDELGGARRSSKSKKSSGEADSSNKLKSEDFNEARKKKKSSKSKPQPVSEIIIVDEFEEPVPTEFNGDVQGVGRRESADVSALRLASSRLQQPSTLPATMEEIQEDVPVVVPEKAKDDPRAETEPEPEVEADPAVDELSPDAGEESENLEVSAPTMTHEAETTERPDDDGGEESDGETPTPSTTTSTKKNRVAFKKPKTAAAKRSAFSMKKLHTMGLMESGSPAACPGFAEETGKNELLAALQFRRKQTLASEKSWAGIGTRFHSDDDSDDEDRTSEE